MSLYAILKDFGEIIAVGAITPILWSLATWLQNRKEKRNAKQNLFLIVMANRSKTYKTEAYLNALNTIDVVFQDNRKVRKAWRDYYDTLYENHPKYKNQSSFLLELLTEMALDLGYNKIRQTDMMEFYEPMKQFEFEFATREVQRLLVDQLLYQQSLRDRENNNNIPVKSDSSDTKIQEN